MPTGGKGYGSMTVGESVATTLKRSPARRVSYDNTNRQVYRGAGEGKFGGLPGGPSGGSMGKGGRKGSRSY